MSKGRPWSGPNWLDLKQIGEDSSSGEASTIRRPPARSKRSKTQLTPYARL
jgi:hypothetical protein